MHQQRYLTGYTSQVYLNVQSNKKLRPRKWKYSSKVPQNCSIYIGVLDYIQSDSVGCEMIKLQVTVGYVLTKRLIRP